MCVAIDDRDNVIEDEVGKEEGMIPRRLQAW